MIAITFSVLSVVACAFLIYVFVHFHRELARLKKRSAEDSRLTYIGSRERSSPYEGELQQAKTEAVMRREILISRIV
jgi:hypothetical protein